MSREEVARKIRFQLTKLANNDSLLSVNDLRIELALERIVARLSADTKLKKHLIYKGGFVLLKMLEHHRFTRDLDALAKDVDKDYIEPLVRSALDQDLNDGLWFGDIKVVPLDEQGEYGALRFDCAFQIGDPPPNKISVKKLSRIHFDVGFGDSVSANLQPVSMPSLIKSKHVVTWKVYPPEFILSEKLQTLVHRQSTNSRGKDVYDLVMLFEECKDQNSIKEAILNTFKRRDTSLPSSFADFASKLDIRVLENSWSSVQQTNEQISFNECWRKLIKQLKKLDEIMAKHLTA